MGNTPNAQSAATAAATAAANAAGQRHTFDALNMDKNQALISDWGIKTPPYSAFSPLSRVRVDNSMYIPSEERFYLFTQANEILKDIKRMRKR